MEEEQLQRSWNKVSGETPAGFDNMLPLFLERTFMRSSARIQRSFRLDYILSLVLSVVIIGAVFIMDLKYKWVIILLIAGFSSLLFIHFRIRNKLLFNFPKENEGLGQMMQRQIRVMKTYKSACLVGIPAFTFIISGSYFTLYSNEFLLNGILLSFALALCMIPVVLNIWKILYASAIQQINYLHRIYTRLNSDQES